MADDRTPIDDLLGAYALDAVDEHERRQVEARLAADPHARDEVVELREVAALLGDHTEAPPPGLWDRIVEVIDDRAPRPGPALASVLPATRRARRRSWLVGAGAAALAAAAAFVVVVAVRDGDTGPALVGGAVEQAYGEAWADPDGRRATLTSEDGTLTADAVVAPSGVGFLAAGALPELPSTETYQLWGVYADGDVISLGVLGHRPGIEPFSAEGDIDAVVITREQAGGVVASTSGALLVGELG